MEPNWTNGQDVLSVSNNTGPTVQTDPYRSAGRSTYGSGSSDSASAGSSGNVSDKSSYPSPRPSTSEAAQRPSESGSPRPGDEETNNTDAVLDAAAARAAGESVSDSAEGGGDSSGSGSVSPKSGAQSSNADLATGSVAPSLEGDTWPDHARSGPSSTTSGPNSRDSGLDIGSNPSSSAPHSRLIPTSIGGSPASTGLTSTDSLHCPPLRTASTVPVTDSDGRSILILLLRNDLRIHDNTLFTCAHRDRAAPPPAWMGEQLHSSHSHHREGNRLGQALLGPGLPNHTLQGIDGGGVFADEWNLASQSQYILPLFVFDERVIELSGLPGYKRQGPEARTPTYGFWKTGGFRVRFIVECIADLRRRLIERGSDLLLRFGKTEQVLEELVSSLQAQGDSVEGVWLQKEAASEDVDVERAIAKSMYRRSVPVSVTYGKTLIHPADLPFDVTSLPDVFTPFRKRVESLGKRMVRATATPPSRFKPFPSRIRDHRNYSLDIDPFSDINGILNGGHKIQTSSPPPYSVAVRQAKGGGPLETLSWDGFMKALLHAIIQPQCIEALHDYSTLTSRHTASAFPFCGGETSALERLEWYFIRGRMSSGPAARGGLPPVARYKLTRNNLLGSGYSTKMSPFLAYGCVSARQIWEVLDQLEERLGEDQSTYWVRFELMWRDYFFLAAAKFGDLLYSLGGFEAVTDPRQAEKKKSWWKMWNPMQDPKNDEINRLLEARTGIPFLDANITELRESGFMSNRGRQNVASFLSKDLACDWRVGAEFFASHLIDYDATSNFGNWQYVAGVGNDPRASRQFNPIKQAKDFDSFGEYVKTWLPILRNLPVDYVHTPWLLSDEERWQYGIKGSAAETTLSSYPSRPMIELESWHKHYDRRDGSGSKMRGNPQEKVKDVTERFRRMKMFHSHAHSHNHSHNHEHHHHHHHHLLPKGVRNSSSDAPMSPRWAPTVGLWRRNQAASGLEGRLQGEESASSGSCGGSGSGSGGSGLSRYDGNSSTPSTGSSGRIGVGAIPVRMSSVPNYGRHRQSYRSTVNDPSTASLSAGSSGNTSSSSPYVTPASTPSYPGPLRSVGARPVDPHPRRPLASTGSSSSPNPYYYMSQPSSDAFDVMGSNDAGLYGHQPDVSSDFTRTYANGGLPSLASKLDTPVHQPYLTGVASESDSPDVPPLRHYPSARGPGSIRGTPNTQDSQLRTRSGPLAYQPPFDIRQPAMKHVHDVPVLHGGVPASSVPQQPNWPSNAHVTSVGPGNREATASASAAGPGATSRASIGRNGISSSSSASSPVPRMGYPSYHPKAPGGTSSLPPNPYRAHNYMPTTSNSGQVNPWLDSHAPWGRP